MRRAVIIFSIILSIALFAVSLTMKRNKRTDASNSSVVILKDRLIELARHNISEITGETTSDESYILLYGYGAQAKIKSLIISENLRSQLKDIAPPEYYEKYILAHIYNNEVQEYTGWEITDEENWHPHFVINSPMIQGKPYRLVWGEGESATQTLVK